MKNCIAKNLFATLLLLLPLLGFSQADLLVGDWKATMNGPDGKTREVKLTLKADGTASVDFDLNGTLEVEGKYTVEGNQITFQDVSGPYACPADQKGVYTFDGTESSGSLTVVSDPCEGRKMSNHKIVYTRM
jgi:hypothetical protein